MIWISQSSLWLVFGLKNLQKNVFILKMSVALMVAFSIVDRYEMSTFAAYF